MELDQFVRDSVFQVISGIKAAQDEIKKQGIGAATSPVWDHANNLGSNHVLSTEFDVVVTAELKNGSEAGESAKISIQVLGADIGKRAQSSSAESPVSRVKFTVPYIPPATVVIRGKGN